MKATVMQSIASLITHTHSRSSHPFSNPGKTAVEMVGGNLGRQEETNFGSLMASLLVKTAKSLDALDAQFGPVDIGLFTGGGIRVDILPGQVTYGDVLTAMPFGNTFAIKVRWRGAGRHCQLEGLRALHRVCSSTRCHVFASA